MKRLKKKRDCCVTHYSIVHSKPSHACLSFPFVRCPIDDRWETVSILIGDHCVDNKNELSSPRGHVSLLEQVWIFSCKSLMGCFSLSFHQASLLMSWWCVSLLKWVFRLSLLVVSLFPFDCSWVTHRLRPFLPFTGIGLNCICFLGICCFYVSNHSFSSSLSFVLDFEFWPFSTLSTITSLDFLGYKQKQTSSKLEGNDQKLSFVFSNRWISFRHQHRQNHGLEIMEWHFIFLSSLKRWHALQDDSGLIPCWHFQWHLDNNSWEVQIETHDKEERRMGIGFLLFQTWGLTTVEKGVKGESVFRSLHEKKIYIAITHFLVNICLSFPPKISF